MTISSKLCSDMFGYQDTYKKLLRDFPDSVCYRLSWQLDTLPLLSSLGVTIIHICKILGEFLCFWSLLRLFSKEFCPGK